MGNVQQMIDMILERAANRPMWEVMREFEEEAGYTIVLPGSEPWFSLDDWDETVVVSRSRREIRLVAILARNPGHGALTRLVYGILSDGLVPVIIAPTLEMRATMKRWNWAPRHVGSGWDHEEQWRPRKGRSIAE